MFVLYCLSIAIWDSIDLPGCRGAGWDGTNLCLLINELQIILYSNVYLPIGRGVSEKSEVWGRKQRRQAPTNRK